VGVKIKPLESQKHFKLEANRIFDSFVKRREIFFDFSENDKNKKSENETRRTSMTKHIFFLPF